MHARWNAVKPDQQNHHQQSAPEAADNGNEMKDTLAVHLVDICACIDEKRE
jgi:hypothetical protein